MRSLLWLTSLLVLGCNDSPGKVTAPAADVPNGGEVNLDKIAANAALGPAARCVKIVYLSEANVLRTKQRGTGCSCLSGGRPVSVTAVVWNGAAGNNVIGRAYCGRPLWPGRLPHWTRAAAHWALPLSSTSSSSEPRAASSNGPSQPRGIARTDW
jgi:hypothetical protein